ncbi:type II CAAX prenyl endopeptidase Rce1 family protein [Candidatus Eisenbacteria bacterium]|uniref:Type II CAAX prenyl endopeptidase Rce1 family protein n=1 Tax=Eiseniibacteriota bacterium TaxID=2212470 RepID=A0ABV6YIP5_UNCEI
MRHIAMASPYVAILAGLHWLGSAWVTILLYHAGLLLYMLCTRTNHRGRRLLAGWNTRAGAAVSVLCAGSGPLLVLLWPAIARENSRLASSLISLGLDGASWWLFVVYYVGVHPIIEEVFWRGVQSSGRRGISIADIAFAGYHALVLPFFVRGLWVLVVSVILMLVAWFWRRLATRYDGLAIPIASHAIAGLSTMAATGVLIDG